MARCAYCDAETELFEGSTPVCIHCADLSPERRATRAKLFGDLAQATRRADVAAEAFVTATSDIPSGIPHPDGVQRIHNASHEMTAARNELIKAHDRLNKFLNTGIVPEDLELSG
jgi:hypothetical protein